MAESSSQSLNWRTPCASAVDVPTDADLLRRFATDRDQAAFTTLVERHGPLVLSVCRRVLGAVQDAEDAFQATFLVLARKAGEIRDPGLLGNWLYGVASRIARKARVAVTKRQTHEKQVRLLPSLEAPAAPVPDDLGPVLDEELSRLPEKYRAALVLCYLEGKTNEEAARLLQWPTGTVKGRLARARDLLRSRLARRGLRASALLLGTFLGAAQAKAAAVSAPLAATTTRAGVGFAAGVSAWSSPAALRLALSVLRAPRRLKYLAVVLALLFGATTWLVGSAAAGWQPFSPKGGGSKPPVAGESVSPVETAPQSAADAVPSCHRTCGGS
jgi:RNA polymerase sigma-70 factor (ECF subfamily)